jgi:hypothetical protein
MAKKGTGPADAGSLLTLEDNGFAVGDNAGFDFGDGDDNSDVDSDSEKNTDSCVETDDEVETRSGASRAGAGAGFLGVKRSRGGIVNKKKQATESTAANATQGRVLVCSADTCCVTSLKVLDAFAMLFFVQSVQMVNHGHVGEATVVKKRQLLFAQHIYNTGILFRISIQLLTAFILAVGLQPASYPLQVSVFAHISPNPDVNHALAVYRDHTINFEDRIFPNLLLYPRALQYTCGDNEARN